MNRKGLGYGQGKGYYNIVPIDSHIHRLSAKGVKYYEVDIHGSMIIKAKNNFEANTKAWQYIKTLPRQVELGIGEAKKPYMGEDQLKNYDENGWIINAKGIVIRPNKYKAYKDKKGNIHIGNKAERDKELKITEAGKKTKGEWAFDLTDFRSKEDWKTFLAKNKFELVGKMKTDEKDKFLHFEYKNPDGFKILTEHNPLEGEDAFLGYVGMTYPKNKETQFKKVVKDFKQGAIDIKEENPHEQTYISDAWLYMNAKGKKDWVDRLYGHKTSKKTKLVTKGVVYTAGALALLGASSRVLRAKGGKR